MAAVMPIVLVPIDLPKGARVIRVELLLPGDEVKHVACAGPILFTKEQVLAPLVASANLYYRT